jgi:hypothetical protein
LADKILPGLSRDCGLLSDVHSLATPSGQNARKMLGRNYSNPLRTAMNSLICANLIFAACGKPHALENFHQPAELKQAA